MDNPNYHQSSSSSSEDLPIEVLAPAGITLFFILISVLHKITSRSKSKKSGQEDYYEEIPQWDEPMANEGLPGGYPPTYPLPRLPPPSPLPPAQQFIPQQQVSNQSTIVEEIVSTPREEFASVAATESLNTMSLNAPFTPVQMGQNVPQQIPLGPHVDLQGDIAEDGYEWLLWKTDNQYYWRVSGSLEWTIFKA